MVYNNLQIEEVEMSDPIAHPHYPTRMLHAARTRYQVVEEAIEIEAQEQGD